MRPRVRRRNEPALRWIRAGVFTAVTWWALVALAFAPPVAIPVAAAAVGVLALFMPGIAVLAAIGALSIPLLAADLVTGVVLLVIGFASIQYLAQDRGRVFLLIISAILLAWAGPVWAVAALAGLLLGASEGAVAALIACLAIQIAGIVAGEPNVGLVASGATATGPVSLADAPANLLAFTWLGPAVSGLSPEPLLTAFSGVRQIPLLLLQPLAWAAGAATTGLVRHSGTRPCFDPVAVVVGVAVTGTLSTTLLAALDSTPATTDLLVAAGGSLAVAIAVASIWEWLFPPLPCTVPSTRSSMRAEDADVDELLSLIAQAEDELASKHTAQTTVMITDMKAFSAMTEEDGSVTSAKVIQRHRDLLIPLIEEAGGSGKSTGGDGLVAAFPTPAAAVQAAARMQLALREHNAAHPSERDIAVRIGIATGEVVLDKSGRPFIGSALNLAARVMNLGDGGQILVSKPVATAARQNGIRTHHHGAFELKNIADAVPVDEVLWSEDVEPQAPRCD